MKRLSIQLNRLKRHHDQSITSYDEISLLDLSHSLRIWAEMKSDLPDLHKGFSDNRVFFTGSPNRKVKTTINKSPYVIAYLPNDGVTTFASNGSIFTSPISDDKEPGMAGLTMTQNEKSTRIDELFIVKCQKNEFLFKFLHKPKITKCNFCDWMGSEIVRINILNKSNKLEMFSLSREIIIKRLANAFEASHSSLSKDGNGYNRFDKPIKELLQYTCGGVPLPYFLILKISQDILNLVPQIIGEKA